ncbi:carbon starvation CstA family protein [Leeuwenhoekiella marinoflava]|uniref:Carbon starvation protein CstA n=2 Tax=Leeuwenhoekiella marinoflava TaxID=988 RepID=A0A4Q0P5I6_9FLAO|nr:carbon starvation CstA family protein [Leeuwenhoekiella marinoflava]RXG21880.1 carbon starvation protein CstA [Leeuwenhoekiella marinoflava]SHG01367.1 Carbon starvation protein CstA [Leeuwenhoekiella marinoflava DSM 3653]
MITFCIAIVILVISYFTYGKLVERIFDIDTNAATPAVTLRDDVDYMPLPRWRIFIIQFLNIAGLGPIFGAIAGAMYGPSAFLWIVLGSVFAGGVHDYFSGMLSLRNKGLSISEVVGVYLGAKSKYLVRIFSFILLIFVGTVFVVGPAKIIDGMTAHALGIQMWIGIILAYYIISTILPINKIISKIYPLFGVAMVLMALGLFGALLINDYSIPELTLSGFKNGTLHPEDTPIFPMLFITISCGAISGFHATQSPLMARCMTNEKQGRSVFYGTMITEGIVALIWAAAAMVVFRGVPGLNEAMYANDNNAAWAANEITRNLLGKYGGFLALIGIVIAPITSGDTAFRSARLILADTFKFDQKKVKNRLLLSLGIFAIAILLTQVNFDVIWRYFAWSNQTLATMVLWMITIYLAQCKKNYLFVFIPSVFMTLVCSSYILLAPEGLQLDNTLSYILGTSFTLIIAILALRKINTYKHL